MGSTRPWFVYVLRDPRDGAPRYVGTTKRTLSQRLSLHLCVRIGAARTQWLDELRELGLRPSIEAVETVGDGHTLGLARAKEAAWIDVLIGRGAKLTNVHNRPLALRESPARALRELIFERHLTDVDAALELGVHVQTLINWMRETHPPAERHRPLIERWSDGLILAAGWPPVSRGKPPPGRRRGVPVVSRIAAEVLADLRAPTP